MNDIQSMLYSMVHLRPNIQQPSPFQRIGNNSIARQAGLQDFDLELEEPDMGVTSGRPGLLEQQQQGLGNRPLGVPNDRPLQTRDLDVGQICCKEWLGGLLKHYYRQAA